MEIYYFGSNGEKVGPVTKERLSQLIESGVVVENTKLTVNGKDYIADQIPTIAQLINRRKASQNGPQSPPMSGDRQTSNSHGQASNPNSFARKIGHLYGAASNHGFAPKLNLNIQEESAKSSSSFTEKSKQGNYNNSSNLVYAKFWSKLHLVIGLLRCALVVLLIIFVLGFIRGYGQFTGPSRDFDQTIGSITYHHESHVDEGMYMMVKCGIGLIITCISYNFLILFCLFMASVVRSADEAQISRSLQENPVQK